MTMQAKKVFDACFNGENDLSKKDMEKWILSASNLSTTLALKNLKVQTWKSLFRKVYQSRWLKIFKLGLKVLLLWIYLEFVRLNKNSANIHGITAC